MQRDLHRVCRRSRSALRPAAYDRAVNDLVDVYFEAWNETDAGVRCELLSRCLADGAELHDPTGSVRGVAGVSERIGAFQESAPGTTVVRSTGADAHNGFARYGWDIVGGDGAVALAGIDVAEHDADGRLRRVVMFFGPLPPTE
jgi:hypothetical protein